MRGDSIRDLYAKTLALLGLGVLAGTGALVDYWPSGVRLPAVESGFTQPEFSLALAIPDQEPEVRLASARPRLHRQPMALPVIDLATLIPGTTELALPETLNDDPYGEGWLVRIRLKDPAQAKQLLSADAYRKETA